MSVVDDLRAARAVIEKGWTQGAFATGPRPRPMCWLMARWTWKMAGLRRGRQLGWTSAVSLRGWYENLIYSREA